MSRDKHHYRQYPRVDFSRAQASDASLITYKLFTRNNPTIYTLLNEESVGKASLNKNVKSVFVIHGWTGSDAASWYEALKSAYLNQNDCNIIYIDWSTYGNLSYGVSSANVKPVSRFIASFIKKSGIDPSKIHLIGHSLGAHLASFVGKTYFSEHGQKIGRITGLDPAGPLWSHSEMAEDERLNSSDADFVDVVHTDVQIYGYTHPCGHVDFYPNGGRNHPGCPSNEKGENGNHRHATRLFAESIYNRTSASEIDFHEDEDYNIIIKHKESSNKVVFGEHVNVAARGVYHFVTNHEEPYLKSV